MEIYKLDIQTLNEILNYLAIKPYVEVFQLIDKLKKLEKII